MGRAGRRVPAVRIVIILEAGHAGSFVRAFGQIVVRVLLGADRAAGDESDLLVEHAAVAGGKDILTGGQRQPEIIVRAVRAHPATRWRMPPVLQKQSVMEG